MSDDPSRSVRSGPWIAAVVAIALALPLAAAVHGVFVRSTQLEVARLAHEGALALSMREQEAALRRQYLSLVLDAQRSPGERVQVLRFLRAVSTDELFTAWAEAELASLMALE